jgi:hypothetical protein
MPSGSRQITSAVKHSSRGVNSLHESLEFLKPAAAAAAGRPGLGSSYQGSSQLVSAGSSPVATGRSSPMLFSASNSRSASPMFGAAAAAAGSSAAADLDGYSSALGWRQQAKSPVGLAVQGRAASEPHFEVLSSLRAASMSAVQTPAASAASNSNRVGAAGGSAVYGVSRPVVMSVGLHGGALVGASTLAAGSSSSSPAMQQQQMRARTGSGDGSAAGRASQFTAGSPVGGFAAGLLPALNNARRKTML